MDYKDVVLLILGAGVSSVGWFAKTIWADLRDTKTELGNVRINLSEKYISYERLKDIMEPVMTALNDIKETLKTKADK